MSKPSSGHFTGTTGGINASKNVPLKPNNNAIISTKGLDTREHPTKYKQKSSSKLKELRQKKKNRTITKPEYRQLEWQTRLNNRRTKGIEAFWDRERFLIKHNLPTTRNWSASQRADILKHSQPKYNGLTMQSHHTYSVAKYPHLANVGKLIYPVTQYEHFNRWHDKNYRRDLPGRPMNLSIAEDF